MRKLTWVLCIAVFVAAAFSSLGQAADAKSLYAKCSGCHGADGSKKALGVGKPLKGMPAEEVAKALRGYKAKTMAGEKKAIMEAQAAQLSEEDITALAELISKF